MSKILQNFDVMSSFVSYGLYGDVQVLDDCLLGAVSAAASREQIEQRTSASNVICANNVACGKPNVGCDLNVLCP